MENESVKIKCLGWNYHICKKRVEGKCPTPLPEICYRIQSAKLYGNYSEEFLRLDREKSPGDEKEYSSVFVPSIEMYAILRRKPE